MLLQERIHHQNRQGCHHDNGHLDRLVRRRNSRIKCGAVIHPAGQHDDLPQQHLNRPLGAVIQIQNRTHISVPIGNRIEQRNGRDCRHGQRQHDPEQDAEVVAAVDFGGFLKAFRDVLEKVFENNHVERTDR
ncbi:hypothetical protein D3C86_1724940 [compost metagenome]